MHTGKKYKLLHRVKDTINFNIDNLHHYSLSLQIGDNDFQICVIDTRHNTCLLLEDYVFPNIENPDDKIEILRNLFDEHHFLLANFWESVKISVKTKKFSLVPDDVFDQGALFDYLKYTADLNPEKEKYFYSHVKVDQAVAVFAVDNKLIEFLDSIYQNIELNLLHQSCALIKGIAGSNRKATGKKIYIYIDRIILHVAALENTKLLYYNQFPIKKFSDYIKYINLIAKELNYDLENNGIVVWGYFKKDSTHLNELKKYYPDLELGTYPPYLTMGYMFDEIPEHHFLDVFGIYLCR